MTKGKLLTGILIGIALGAILVGGLSKVTGAPETGTELRLGRFQLFQGTVRLQNDGNKSVESKQLLFLLDSDTGEVKYYSMMVTTEDIMIGDWLPTKYKAKILLPATSYIPLPTQK